MNHLSVQTAIQFATTAPALGVRLDCLVEVRTQPSATSPSPPPTDLEIVRVMRSGTTPKAALPRPSGVTKAKGGRGA